MIIQKYGGSSLSSMDKMKAIAKRIAHAKETHQQVVVVVSAMGQTTNNLIQMANSAVKNPSKRELDMLLSTGEQVSTSLLAMMLNEMGLKALSLNGFQAGIQTEGLYTKNKIKDIDLTRINQYLADDFIVVITGFQGYNPLIGDITTLGRGGSDTTAVALAAKFNCACDIFTDVDGIHTIDPRRYKDAKRLKTITYEEMSELAFLGARVMEGRAVEIAQKYGVTIRVAQAHSNKEGTIIKEKDPMIEEKHITGISVKEDIIMVTLHRLSCPEHSVAELFSTLADNEINVDMISQTLLEDGTISIAFTCDSEEIEGVRETINQMHDTYPGFFLDEDSELCKVSVVGIGMRSQSGVAAKMFRLLSTNSIRFKLVTTSDISISYTIPESKRDEAVALIAKTFNL